MTRRKRMPSPGQTTERTPEEKDQTVKVISDVASQAVVLSVAEFVVGVVDGKLRFNGVEWRWA